jgi:hypothetical protein
MEKFDGVPPVLCVDPFGMRETLDAFDTVIRVDPARPNATKRQIILRQVHYSAVYHHVAGSFARQRLALIIATGSARNISFELSKKIALEGLRKLSARRK